MSTMTSDAARAAWKAHVYNEKLPEDIGRMRHLLETYSKISAEEVDEHLYKIRDKAWAVAQYPCIGRWSFLSLRVVQDRRYQDALARLTSPGSQDALLDLACCMGQIIRQLVADGVDGRRLFGSDLHAGFVELGYELFRDREILSATFAAGDMLAPSDPSLTELDGRIAIIHAANFFHLFTWQQQVVIGSRMVRFLKPGTRDALIFGRQIGSVQPAEQAPFGRNPRFLHDGMSFQKLWDEVGEKTGTRWRVEVDVVDGVPVQIPGFGEDARYVRYGVYQIT